ncbi:FAD-dependent oxidoreductase [Actinomadura sp. B10D3]|uniref:oxidoreductase n=1 Tax=Actinomadura sp. B10D3 TaxID=3153557 RepID=UPI00325D2500
MQKLPASFEYLFQPLDLGPRTLRNRVQVTAHTTLYVDDRQFPGARDAAYFAERSRGGAALMTMGTSIVHSSSPLPYGVYRNVDDEIIPRYRAVADAVHEHGGLVQAQLGHLAQRIYDRPEPAWSPSPVSVQGEGRIPHEMTVGEIGEVVEAFGAAAARAIRGGMDGVELSCGHGQLVNLFLSPLTNRRTDEYGGTAERRARFAREILQAIANAIGDQHIIGIRVNASDEIEGGMDEPQALEVIDLLVKTGIPNYVNVSAGFFDSPIPTMHHPHGVMVPYASMVKRRVSLPVFAVGRIVDPEHAEQVLAEGHADVVGMTRAHIADPHIVRKTLEGRRDEIRPCIGCVQMCVGELHKGRSIGCVYNAVTGHERERAEVETTPTATARRVVVIGGGPGGLEAARVAAARGHEVVLLERDEHLGGKLSACAAAPGRGEFGRARDWWVSEIDRLGVDVRTGVSADVATVLDLDPAVVVVATGAVSASGDWGRLGALGAAEVMAMPEPPSGRVVVVDEDHRGQALFVASHLQAKGATVAVTSSRPVVGGDLEHHTLEDVYKDLLDGGAELLPGWAPVDLRAGNGSSVLRLRNVFTSAESSRPVDAVVTTGARPDDSLAYRLKEHTEVLLVGDVLGPRRVESAVQDAFTAAAAI